MRSLYDKVCLSCSRLTTKEYTTSFFLGILMLRKNLRPEIYSIYGFVRFADEIVDTLHGHDQKKLLDRFKTETYLAIDEGISTNPILHSFQKVVNEFSIEKETIEQFFVSMEMDLYKNTYQTEAEYEQYILGSAQVVGLMCLRVFCHGDEAEYQHLKHGAMMLGSAFQKVNFLRDMKDDYEALGRVYFPNVDFRQFDHIAKAEIEEDIQKDFTVALESIKQLPASSRLGVYTAYLYYQILLNKINRLPANTLKETRVRISNPYKLYLMLLARLKFTLNVI